MASRQTVVLVNPISAALRHYEDVLVETLKASGADVVSLGCLEPSVAGESKVRWLLRYLRLLVRARRAGSTVLVLWPALGYLDAVICALLGRGRYFLVLHDPRPLVDARGYGPKARRLASLRLLRTQALVHSKTAYDVVAEDADVATITLLPLPIAEPEPTSSLATRSASSAIRVLGQYKPDRDTDALVGIAKVADPSWQLEVVGRRWPDIEGWKVTDRFIPEDEFGKVIEESAVVLIPYRRFYQSDVAIRCIESGIPVVGPAGTSLEELLGANHRWLVREDWIAPVRSAIGDRAEAERIHREYYDRTIGEFSGWIATRPS